MATLSLDTALSMLFLVLALLAPVNGLSQSYCSNQNSASDTTPAYWQYQSNGWCHDHCTDAGGYAFAIVQDFNCWCSNLVPSNQVDVDECSDTCPGFGTDNCGNKGHGLFGYIALSEKPSGTYSGPAVSQSRSARPGSVTSSSDVSSDASSSDVQSRTMTETSVQTAGKSTTVSTSTSSQSTPIVTIQIITESGAPITKTVTIMPNDPNGQMEQTSKKSSSSGVIAGAVVGAIVGLAAIIGVLVWCLWFQRRKLRREKDSEKASGAGQVIPQRHPSTLSKSGLLRTERDYPPTLAIPGPTRHSSNGTEGISPISGGGSSDRRHSKPLFYDQRLNPSALMDLDNGSHTSIATMEDNKDYTRTLNVRNPDPPDA